MSFNGAALVGARSGKPDQEGAVTRTRFNGAALVGARSVILVDLEVFDPKNVWRT